ncbi:ASCH domain-containing protein [Myroides odoratimimus]|uniref:ASCH domain-containing protein n=1 Tax=Myroides odoratimimus TaxID=76832 RepID=UPI0025787CD1|nr:ASCH domain-containing protein [Myroides odoratimimus]MDM1494968.1 ASCH domain-containing protein [Myroides odoratimimus]MDM1505388.1 ASCH domain-containing protein [Myroides odoratimimus]MDM1515815.1 ASCH domain-containing protein [Myroides odoratimimus]
MAGITKAISVKQPWAELICLGIKDVENRTWKTKFRGRVFIHAPMHPDKTSKLSKEREEATAHIEEFHFKNSAIIGEATIVDCVQNHKSIWADKGEGIWHWVLKDAVFYDKPIENVKGRLGIWNINLEELNQNGE